MSELIKRLRALNEDFKANTLGVRVSEIDDAIEGLQGGVTEEERQAMIMAVARSFGGWNDDITEPTIEDPKHRSWMEARWKRINDSCIEQATDEVDIALQALIQLRKS